LRIALGQRLRAIRQERGLSQQDLGASAGLSGKFIGEVERGDKSVSVDSLYRVGKVLKVSLAELVDGPRPGKRTA
jgi:transcriptional regulator with XRE-family HTH domain